MSKRIAIINQKGGVGKTTTCVNLAVALSKFGKRVLIIDGDPQGHASLYLGLRDSASVKLTNVMDYVIKNRKFDPHEAILHHQDGVDIVVSDQTLSDVETSLIDCKRREYVLKTYLDMLDGEYDYIVIDSGPAFNLWVVNILVASSSVIIPVQPQAFAAQGMVNFFFTYKGIISKLNRNLKVEGILFTLDDRRLLDSKMTKKEVAEAYGAVNIFKTIIPRSDPLAVAVRNGVSVYGYKPNCAGAEQYLCLAKEVLANEKK